MKSKVPSKIQPTYAMQIHPKYLLVDLDGTLLGAYNLFVHIRFIRKMLWFLRRFGGWKIALKTLVGLVKALNTPIPGTPELRLTNADRVAGAISLRLSLPVEESKKFLEETLGKVFPSLQPFFYPLPGAREFLEWARSRFPMVLATNPAWPLEIIEMRVKWAGIDPTIFKSITHAGRMYSCKPEKDYYQEILLQENFRAEECILIGNDLKNDLPAVRVGIPVFIVSKKKGLRPIPVPPGCAPAWTGDFNALKDLIK